MEKENLLENQKGSRWATRKEGKMTDRKGRLMALPDQDFPVLRSRTIKTYSGSGTRGGGGKKP